MAAPDPHSVDAKFEDVAFEKDFSCGTLAEEHAAGGWTNIAKPVGGEPDPAPVAGTAGSGSAHRT